MPRGKLRAKCIRPPRPRMNSVLPPPTSSSNNGPLPGPDRSSRPKRPYGLLPAGNDFNLQSRGRLDGGNQILGIDRVARGAGGDDADGPGAVLARRPGKIGDGIGGIGDGLHLQPAGFIKALAEAGLPAFLVHRLRVATTTSATNNLMELVPTSMTARRIGCMSAFRLRATQGDAQVKKTWRPTSESLEFARLARFVT